MTIAIAEGKVSLASCKAQGHVGGFNVAPGKNISSSFSFSLLFSFYYFTIKALTNLCLVKTFASSTSSVHGGERKIEKREVRRFERCDWDFGAK
jgi:hypothetical protein